MSEYCVYLRHLAQLDVLQRSLLLINLRKAVCYYDGKSSSSSSEAGALPVGSARRDEQAETQISDLLKELELPSQDTQATLQTMIDLLIATMPSVSPSPNAAPPTLLPQPNALPAAARGGVPQLPRNRVSIVINLDAIPALVVPILALTLKIGFLLWIFARHASPGKKIVLFVMAGIWIVWEAYLLQRRIAIVPVPAVPRRRHAAPAAAQPPQPQAQQPPQRAAAGQGAPVPADAGAANQLLRRRRRRPPPSRISPRYWINSIAAIGLAEEARELGLTPRSIAGRPIAPPPASPNPLDPANYRPEYPTAVAERRRMIRTIFVAIVLFFGTLSPEIERKRKKAIEKRDKLLAQKQEAKERKLARRSRARQGQPGVSGAEDEGDPNASCLGRTVITSENDDDDAATPPQRQQQQLAASGDDDTDLDRLRHFEDDDDDDEDQHQPQRDERQQQGQDDVVAVF